MRLKEFVTEYSQLKKQRAHRDGLDLEVRSNDKNVSIYAHAGGKELAHVHFDKDGKNLVPYDLAVGEDYRGQGIAAVMYDWAKDLGYIVKRSPEQTDAGKAFWNKNRGEEGQVWENFADGKKPGRKGLAKRSGVNCKQSVTKLRSIAAHSSGERQRMAHWCANMKSGRSKK
jgi:GNAT superfamily N-acetyltransferase